MRDREQYEKGSRKTEIIIMIILFGRNRSRVLRSIGSGGFPIKSIFTHLFFLKLDLNGSEFSLEGRIRTRLISTRIPNSATFLCLNLISRSNSYTDLFFRYADCPGEGLYRLHDECVAGKLFLPLLLP